MNGTPNRSDLSEADTRALDTYERGYHRAQKAVAEYDSGWQTYIENLPRDGTHLPNYPSDWQDLFHTMKGAMDAFRKSIELFTETRQQSESAAFHDPCVQAVDWADAYLAVLDWFTEYGGPPRRRAIELHHEAKTTPVPLPPDELVNVVLGRATPDFEMPSYTFTPVQTREQTPTEREEPTETERPTAAPHPDQPQIRAVADNFGHRFTFDRDASEQVHVTDEVVVSDDTELEVCVTDVAKRSGDEIEYHYTFGHSANDHPDNSRAWGSENCHRWKLNREYYTARWTVDIHIRNQDDIFYQNRDFESDYRVVIMYDNLSLPTDT